jgi:hypothetical protein
MHKYEKIIPTHGAKAAEEPSRRGSANPAWPHGAYRLVVVRNKSCGAGAPQTKANVRRVAVRTLPLITALPLDSRTEPEFRS